MQICGFASFRDSSLSNRISCLIVYSFYQDILVNSIHRKREIMAHISKWRVRNSRPRRRRLCATCGSSICSRPSTKCWVRLCRLQLLLVATAQYTQQLTRCCLWMDCFADPNPDLHVLFSVRDVYHCIRVTCNRSLEHGNEYCEHDCVAHTRFAGVQCAVLRREARWLRGQVEQPHDALVSSSCLLLCILYGIVVLTPVCILSCTLALGCAVSSHEAASAPSD